MLRGFLKLPSLKITYFAIDLAFKSATTYFLYRIYNTLTHSLPIAITNNTPNLDDLNNSIVLEDSQISVNSSDLDQHSEQDDSVDNDTGIQKRSFWSLGNYLNNTTTVEI